MICIISRYDRERYFRFLQAIFFQINSLKIQDKQRECINVHWPTKKAKLLETEENKALIY